jgi:hypothetical protein
MLAQPLLKLLVQGTAVGGELQQQIGTENWLCLRQQDWTLTPSQLRRTVDRVRSTHFV